MTSLFVLSAECERNPEPSASSRYSLNLEKSELVMATAERLKLGLNAENLRRSGKVSSDGMEVFTPKSNYGRFTREGLMIARVATTDIRCNHKEVVELVSSQGSREKWDTSCAAVYPIKLESVSAGSSTSKGLSHFVEKASIGGTFLPLRDYIVDVLEPYPGEAISFL